MAAFLPRARSRIIGATPSMYRVRRKGSVLLMVAAVPPFMALEFSPTLLVDHFIDRGLPELEPACSHLAENVGDEEEILYRMRADRDGL
jgi:hypothetical protein